MGLEKWISWRQYVKNKHQNYFTLFHSIFYFRSKEGYILLSLDKCWYWNLIQKEASMTYVILSISPSPTRFEGKFTCMLVCWILGLGSLVS